ncbi:endonuclease domain-containing protein [Methylocystis sp. MJC1]|uniref:hypothetical protein n=1 Tax=Methylocystis sp. MJC1 TaxID=2654282 RepID=UPI0013EC44AF|nr:hypothetical protein [Methylocystis sp. MJC1]MBU6527764.1 hypothetical protein [Methylocystis sp. MJC1]UZX10694.1 endonuclease domain-containing protein [Methylocystis sp. MJC1]
MWFANNGFSVLRVTDAEVYAEFEGVLEKIYRRAEENLPPPCPSPAKAGEGTLAISELDGGDDLPPSPAIGRRKTPVFRRAKAGEGWGGGLTK